MVRLVIAGHRNRGIARILYRSPRTVETQLNSAMRKLGVTSRAALAVRVIEGGLLGKEDTPQGDDDRPATTP